MRIGVKIRIVKIGLQLSVAYSSTQPTFLGLKRLLYETVKMAI